MRHVSRSAPRLELHGVFRALPGTHYSKVWQLEIEQSDSKVTVRSRSIEC